MIANTYTSPEIVVNDFERYAIEDQIEELGQFCEKQLYQRFEIDGNGFWYQIPFYIYRGRESNPNRCGLQNVVVFFFDERSIVGELTVHCESSSEADVELLIQKVSSLANFAIDFYVRMSEPGAMHIADPRYSSCNH